MRRIDAHCTDELVQQAVRTLEGFRSAGICFWNPGDGGGGRGGRRSGHSGRPHRAPVHCPAWTFFAFHLFWNIPASAQLRERVMKD